MRVCEIQHKIASFVFLFTKTMKSMSCQSCQWNRGHSACAMVLHACALAAFVKTRHVREHLKAVMHSEHFAGLLPRFRISSMVIQAELTLCHLHWNVPIREVPALLAFVNLVGKFTFDPTNAALVLLHRHWTKEQKNAAGECCLNHMLCVTHKHARGDEHTRSRTIYPL